MEIQASCMDKQSLKTIPLYWGWGARQNVATVLKRKLNSADLK